MYNFVTSVLCCSLPACLTMSYVICPVNSVAVDTGSATSATRRMRAVAALPALMVSGTISQAGATSAT